MKRRCRIISSPYSDVRAGDKGTILKIVEDGYAVELTQPFYRADALQKSPATETRTFWFKKSEVKKIKKKIK